MVCENALAGTPQSVWDVSGAGDADIQGFATQISVNLGQTVQFKINTTAAAYKIEIYRLGYYQGDGARKQADVAPSATLPQTQPACATDATTEIYDCGTWGVSASWAVPSTAVSGVYIARLIRTDNGDSSHIPFIVRDDSSHSQVVFQTSDPTWEAYNTYGQSDFYQGLANGRAYKVSYNRPITTRGQNSGRDFLFANEYPMIRFMEQNGYDVSYISGLDSAVNGSLLTNHKVFVDAGHDEYWSAGQRANVEAARDAGVSLAFFSGNEVYWRTRWEASQDGTNTANRTLVCYKDTWANAPIDPLGPTATWRDPRFGGNGEGPENSLTGTMYMSNFTDLAITVSATEGATRLWRNTPLASQAPGTSTALLAHTIGYESDEDVDNGHRPAGLVDLSTTTGPTPQYLQDFGNAVLPGTTTHHVTLYKAASGALVFGAGTIQWAWGVDADHDGTAAPADPRLRQATINILADMGASATTLASDLVPSTKSTDTTAPVAVITAPAANSASQQGSLVTVTGTATDSGGGVVAGVEVSVDGGLTWHPAPISGSGTKTFTFTGVLTGTGAQAIQARATDDSGNIQSPVTTLALQVSCPCSMFGATTPGTLATTDAQSLTLGVRFSSSAAGFITGVRFYKGAGNTGTHVGTLYDSSGAVLSSVTFTGETATGWQMATFPAAVPVAAGTTYIAAYKAPVGHYAADNYYFITSGHTAGTLTALGGPANPTNGMYGSGNSFPTQSYQNSNYYVDAIYSAVDTTPLSASIGSPIAGASSVLTSTTVTASFSRPITASSVAMTVANAANAAVPGSVTYNSTTRQVTFDPTQPLSSSTTYTVRLSAISPDVGAMAAPLAWSFTTAAAPSTPGVCPCSLFPDTSVPATGPVADTPVRLGMAFSSDLNGTITGIRFYKDPTNSGPHTVSLYTASGTLMGTANTTAESTSGWQNATFPSPIAISRGTLYVASYLTSSGHYSYTLGGLASVIDAPPLHAPAGAGRYAYSGAPTSASSSNYFVDPIFAPAPDSAPVVASTDPSDNSTSVPVSARVTATFVGTIQAASVSIAVVADDGTSVPGSVANESLGTAATFVPTAAFAQATHYTVTISGAVSSGGTAMTTPTVTHFTTSGTAACPCSVFASGAVPATSDSGDAGAVTVGLKFTPTVNGSITGIRYYRDATNTGTHTGTLYSADGSKLTTLSFPTPTTTGWQSATFATPIVVTAGITYVAATYMPVGHYSINGAFFSAPYVNAPLTGVAGVYTYGSDTFPTSSYNNGNYWVDVAFVPGTATPPTLLVSHQTPAPGATGISTTSTPSAAFSAAIDPTTLQMSVTGPNGAVVNGAAAYNTSTLTATFTPAAALSPNSTYTVSVGAAPAGGGAAVTPTTWSFTTLAPAAPRVASQTPAAGATGVSPTTAPSGTFAAPIDASSLQFTLTGPGGASVPGVGSYNTTTLTATFTPTAPLADNTHYTATITANSAAGSPIAAPFSWSFTTAAPAAPTVSGQLPAAGATAVQTSTAISAVFNAPIDPTTLKFTLAGSGSTTVAGAANYNAITHTVTFQPTAPLAGGTTYTASLAATGTNGGVMASPSSWSFSTTTATALVVQNGGFEGGLTGWAAGGITGPTASTTAAHTGAGSALLGTLSGAEPSGDSTLSQTISIPATGVTTLSLWYRPATADTVCSGSGCVYDWQEAQLRSTSGATLTSLFKRNSNSQTWTQVSVDVSAYHGQSVVLWFNVHGDGSTPADDTSMYLDDVAVTTSQPTAPAKPAGVTAAAGNAAATVSWAAPTNGGSAITSYTITPYLGAAAQTPTVVTGAPPATRTTITGLANGTAYTFTVTATNAVGTGPASAPSSAVTPTAPTAPGVPAGVTAAAANASATVSWTAPTNGGSAITSYTITPYLGAAAQAPTVVTGAPPATRTTITGLANGTAYTFTVTATNAVGTGPASAASSAVTPTATALVVQNGGFEGGLTGWAAGGITGPTASTTAAHTGAGSALLGTLSGAEPSGDSTLSQTISIPATGVTTLSLWYRPATADTVCSGSGCVYDWQEAQLRSTSGATLTSLFKRNSNSQTWTQVSVDVSAYHGQSVVLWFNVHGDGSTPADDTSMHLDDVTVTTGP